MRIAIWHNLPSGGGKRALYDQVRGLTARGHHVEAWCPPTASQFFLPLSDLIKEHVVQLEPTKSRTSGWLARRKDKATETQRKMAAMERHCEECAREIARREFDLLLVHPCCLFAVSPIALYSQLPNVLYLQEPFRLLYEASPKLIWAAPTRDYRPYSPWYWNDLVWELLEINNKRVQVRQESAWIQNYDEILVNSLFSRESVLRTYNQDSRVCYLGIDTNLFRPKGRRKERLVIGLGSLYPHKRPLLAVQVVGAVPPDCRPKLIWVGNYADPDYLEVIQREAHKLEVDFTFRLRITDEELLNLLSRAAAMIYTSQLEPFGYAPLEANACGTGVVGIAEGGIRETVGHPDGGVLVPGSKPEDIALELSKFTSDLSFAESFGKRARSYVETHWSDEAAINRIESELKRAVVRRHASKVVPAFKTPMMPSRITNIPAYDEHSSVPVSALSQV